MSAPAIVGVPDFPALFEEYSGRIYRYLCALVRDAGLAEDLAQDTFVKAHHALAQGARPENGKAWLYTIATNTALSALRRRRLLAWLPLVGGREDERLAVEESHEAAVGERDLIRRSLRELPRDDAACLLLRFEHGLTYEELAVALGCSVPAARMRVSRARAGFREAYLRHTQEV